MQLTRMKSIAVSLCIKSFERNRNNHKNERLKTKEKKWRTTEKSATAKDYPFTGLSIHVTRNGFNMFILHIYRIKVRNFFIICKFRNANKRKERKKKRREYGRRHAFVKVFTLRQPVYTCLFAYLICTKAFGILPPIDFAPFFLSLSFFLAILFRMNNIFSFFSYWFNAQCSVVVAVLPNSKQKFSHVSFCSVDFISLYCSAHRTGLHGCGGAGTLTVIPYHQFRFIFELWNSVCRYIIQYVTNYKKKSNTADESSLNNVHLIILI